MVREVKEPMLNRLQYLHIDEAVGLGTGQSDHTDRDVWPHDRARGQEFGKGLEYRIL